MKTTTMKATPIQMTLTILSLLFAVPPSGARADDTCFVPMANWQPRAAVAQFAQDNGWTVLRIKIDDGCYEVIGHDAAGNPIEVTIHPATLQVLKFEYEDEEPDNHQPQTNEPRDDN